MADTVAGAYLIPAKVVHPRIRTMSSCAPLLYLRTSRVATLTAMDTLMVTGTPKKKEIRTKTKSMKRLCINSRKSYLSDVSS